MASQSRAFMRVFSAVSKTLCAATLALSCLANVAAQSSLPESAGCQLVNSGIFDFSYGGGQGITSFDETVLEVFNAGETLTFTYDIVVQTLIRDNTDNVDIVNVSSMILPPPPQEMTDYEIPASGVREIRVLFETTDDAPETEVYAQCTPAPASSITISKTVIGTGEIFSFSGDITPVDINLTNNATASGTTEMGLSAGSYTILETLIPSYDVTAIDCGPTSISSVDVAGGAVTIDLAVGEDATCSFTNTEKRGTITIIKNVNGQDGTFTFDDGISPFDITTSGGTGSEIFTQLPPTIYSFSEIVPNGYALDNIQCDQQNALVDISTASVVIDLVAGQDVICTFTNSELPGSITIEKQVIGGGGTFTFSGDIDPVSITVADNAMATGTPQTGVSAGSYVITEAVLTDYDVTAIDCGSTALVSPADLSTGSVTIALAAGEDAICRFTNTEKLGSITIAKTVVGTGGTFNFTGDITPVSITVADNAMATGTTQTGVSAGSYVITEALLTDYDVTAIDCGSTALVFPADLSTGSVTIDLAAGEDATCRFTNTEKLGSITIAKTVVGTGGTFNFTGDITPVSITVADNAMATGTTQTGVSAGSYTITETIPATYLLTDINCGSAAVSTAADLTSGSITIDLAPGENAVCLFTNTELAGSITIAKTVIGKGGTFSFTGDFFSGADIVVADNSSANVLAADALPVGDYTLSEIVPADYMLSDISCNSATTPSINGSSVLVSLAANEDVICTFTNTEITADLTIVSTTTGVDEIFNYTSAELNDFANDTAGAGQSNFASLSAGTFNISQAVSSISELTSIECDTVTPTIDIANGTLSVDLAAGDVAICSFNNTALKGSITIVENTIGGEGVFDFSGDLSTFSIATTSFTGQQAFVNLDAASIIVSQAANADFELLSITCTGDSDNGSQVNLSAASVTIDLDAAEDITCTFLNNDLFDEDKFIDDTNETITGFLYRRARGLLNMEPDRTNFYRRNPEALWGDSDTKVNKFSGRADDHGASMQFAASTGNRGRDDVNHGVEIWIEGQYSTAKDRVSQVDIEGELGVFYLGADIMLRDNLIVGALASFDWANEDWRFIDTDQTVDLTRKVSGTGWMVGPYLSAKLNDNLFFTTRIAAGQSDNKLSLDTRVVDDKFETDRFLARAALTGNKNYGDFRITPTASVSWLQENQKQYLSQTGVTIPENTVKLGRAELKPEIAWRHETQGGTMIEPQISFSAIYDFEKPEDLTAFGVPLPIDDFHGKVEAGVQFNFESGNSMRFAGSYDGIGTDNYEAWTAGFWVDMPLGRSASAPTPKPAPVIPAPAYKICDDGTRILEVETCPPLPPEPPTAPEDLAFVVLFDHDKSNLLSDEVVKIDNAVAMTKDRDIKIVLLQGHTDLSGSNAYNEGLSLRRAVVVRDALIARGIPVEQITYEFFGETHPAVPTADGVRLRANRRTEVVIKFE